MTQMKNANKRFQLIDFAREQSELMLNEAERVSKMNNKPECGMAYPINIKLSNGDKTIGAFCNITFESFGTFDIVIFRNSNNQIVIRDYERKEFLVKVDYCEDIDDYDWDNADIVELERR